MLRVPDLYCYTRRWPPGSDWWSRGRHTSSLCRLLSSWWRWALLSRKSVRIYLSLHTLYNNTVWKVEKWYEKITMVTLPWLQSASVRLPLPWLQSASVRLPLPWLQSASVRLPLPWLQSASVAGAFWSVWWRSVVPRRGQRTGHLWTPCCRHWPSTLSTQRSTTNLNYNFNIDYSAYSLSTFEVKYK